MSMSSSSTGGKRTEEARGTLTESITDVLQKGNSFHYRGFGAFEVRERGERTGLNPKTGEELKIVASKVPEEWVRKMRAAKTGDELAALIIELPERQLH
jgi:DNA-binding protein HU-beta